MTITITPKPPSRETYEVKMDGRTVGEIKPHDANRWHASITLRFGGPLDNTLIQGFGLTHEEAIESAIRSALQYHERSLRAIEQFRDANTKAGAA